MSESLNETVQRLVYAEAQAENFIERAGGTPDEVPESDSVLYHVRVARHWLKQAIEEHDVGLLTAASDAPGPFAPPNEVAAGNFPNEPDGYSTVMEFTGAQEPTSSTLFTGDKNNLEAISVGTGYMGADSNWNNTLHSVESSDGPVGGSMLRIVFPVGMTDGSPGIWNSWGPTLDVLDDEAHSDARPNGFELDEMYVSWHFNIRSGSGDGQWEWTKGFKPLGYFNLADISNAAYFVANEQAESNPNIKDCITTFAVTQQGPLTRSVFNIATICADTWYQLEMVATLNDIGSQNGTLEVWLDGTKIVDLADWEWRTSASPEGFGGIHGVLEWSTGGGGYERTREDYVDFDHVRVSGIELAGVN